MLKVILLNGIMLKVVFPKVIVSFC
jgi:hypothetical protein